MREDQVAALDSRQLSILIDNVRSKAGPEAERILAIACLEQSRRASAKPPARKKRGLTWSPCLDFWRAGDKQATYDQTGIELATIQMLDQHSKRAGKDVFRVIVRGELAGIFEKIDDARAEVERRLVS